MDPIAQAEAAEALSQIQAAITAGVQAAQQLAGATARVNSLWQSAKAVMDEATLVEAYAAFGNRCGSAWATAKPSLESAFDILAGGVNVTRNQLLDSLKTVE